MPPRNRRIEVNGISKTTKGIERKQRQAAPQKQYGGRQHVKHHAATRKTLVDQKPMVQRPETKLLTNLATNVTRIQMPEKGSFNPGLVKMPHNDKYVMVYRPDEHRFTACILDRHLRPDAKSYFTFGIRNCADPRLVWLPNNKLLMVYSSTTKVGLNYECIRGSIIMDLNKSEGFINDEPFRISPEMEIRQKNWMPFVHDDKIYLIASILPHIIYEMTFNGDEVICEQKFETKWLNPWFFPKDFLRGNTNPVRLESGNYLGTFHTAVWSGPTCYYDNGCYLFEGKPPFKVIKCANKTYLPAEGAIEPHFRNGGRIACTFPVGMVREDNDLLISYGDNDSVVKVMRTTVDEMDSLMLELY